MRCKATSAAEIMDIMRYAAAFPACLVALGLSAFSLNAHAQEQGSRVEVVKPPERTERAQRAAIDSEHFEVGAYLGALSVEDFSTQLSVGLTLNYHLSTRFMVQAHYARSDVERATFEEISGGNFLSDSDRTFEHLSVLAGYRLAEGRSFFGGRRKFNSYLYALAGPSQISFAGEDHTGLAFGLSYKTVLTDWATLNLDVRDLVVDRSFLGDDKTTHNTELAVGLNLLF